MQWRYSLTGKIVLWGFVIAGCASACAVGIFALSDSAWLAFIVTFTLIAIITAWSGHVLLATTTKLLQALTDGLHSLRANDFSVSISHVTQDELQQVAAQYNQLGDALRRERQHLYQRELLLDTVIQASPMALILINNDQTVLYSNTTSRQLLYQGKKLEGLRLNALLESASVPLREALLNGNDTLFTMELNHEPEVFHLSCRQFSLNAQAHRLFLLKQLTREINAQEVAIWKKVIRVLSHELNNSLAPISSLLHSAKQMIDQPHDAQLQKAFATIDERVAHLHSFIAGYARFAKLPKPQIAAVFWPEFLSGLRMAVPFSLATILPTDAAYFDRAQLSQVLLNIIKNAMEAGSTPENIEVNVKAHEGGYQLAVSDRGSGMSENVLQSAVLPFYSTKASGTGLGLALCREIIEAHGGRLHLANRTGGGAVVTVWLPSAAGI